MKNENRNNVVLLKDYQNILGIGKTTAVKYRKNDRKALKLRKGVPITMSMFQKIYYREIFEQMLPEEFGKVQWTSKI